MVESFVKSTYFSTNTIDEFSSEMFRFLYFFKEKDERMFVLGTILYFDSVMPYKQLPAKPLVISDADFTHLLKSNPERIEMIQYIEGLPFDSYAEELSMVLQVIDECADSRPLRVALLSAYVHMVRNRVKKAYEEK